MALVQLLVRPRDVVDLPDDPVHRGVGDDHDTGRVQRHGEVGKQLKIRLAKVTAARSLLSLAHLSNEFDLIVEVFGPDAGA